MYKCNTTSSLRPASFLSIFGATFNLGIQMRMMFTESDVPSLLTLGINYIYFLCLLLAYRAIFIFSRSIVVLLLNKNRLLHHHLQQ